MDFRKKLVNILLENSKNIWYHGTYDYDDIMNNGFQEKTKISEYIKDLDTYNVLKDKINKAHSEDTDLYFELLDQVPKTKSKYQYYRPIFLTNNIKVAKTYSDINRSYDTENSKEGIVKVNTDNCNKILTIQGNGNNFNEIKENDVINALIKAGVNEKDAINTVKMFNFHRSKGNIRTDVIIALANYLKFDCVLFKNILDSYSGGNIKSDVKAILQPKKAKIQIKESKTNKKTFADKLLAKSRGYSQEMKDEIRKHLNSSSTYKNKKFFGLKTPKELVKRLSDKKVDIGCSFGADKNGFFCYTHRARSKSKPKLEKLPISDIKFINSTG